MQLLTTALLIINGSSCTLWVCALQHQRFAGGRGALYADAARPGGQVPQVGTGWQSLWSTTLLPAWVGYSRCDWHAGDICRTSSHITLPTLHRLRRLPAPLHVPPPRFCANDPRCNMELDEVDPERWAQLEAATEEYVAAPTTQAQYAEAASVLLQVRAGWARLKALLWFGCCVGKCLLLDTLLGCSCPTCNMRPCLSLMLPQAEAALAVEPPQGGLKLGTRRKLLVLRAPRLGAQQLSVADAVAASLAYRPGCVAVVDLQRLGQAQHEAGITSQLAGQLATMPSSSDAQQPRCEVFAPAPTSDEPSRTASSQARSSEDEGGGLSAYISSWFSSPTKQANLASPPAAATGSSGRQQQQQQPLPPQEQLQQQQDSTALQADVPGRVVSSVRTARSPVVTSARQHAGNSAALASAAEGLAAKLEEQLAALLPSVGVVHLGLELAGAAGLVLRWQQQLQAVAEPSESRLGLKLSLFGMHLYAVVGGACSVPVTKTFRQEALRP